MKNTPPGLICLIDDDKIYQLIITRIIEMINPQQKVISFFNGQQAIEFFIGQPASFQFPDIILLDINMPVMNGWEFLEAFTALREIPKRIPVYMVSSSVNEDDALRSKSFEIVQDFIVKPICKIKIAEILNEAAAPSFFAGQTRNAHLPN